MQGQDNTAPTITGRSPSQNATDVPATATSGPVQRADEPGDDRRPERPPPKAGVGQRRTRQRQLSGEYATLDPNGDLDPSAVYTVTVDGSVEDRAGNALGARTPGASPRRPRASTSPTPRSPTSAPARLAPTPHVSETGNGEVILSDREPRVLGQLAPAEWKSCPWSAPDGDCTPGQAPPSLTAAASARRRLLRQDHRDLPVRPLARVQAPPSLSRTIQHIGFAVADLKQLGELGDLQRRSSTGPSYARTNNGGSNQPGRSFASAPASAARISTGSSGTPNEVLLLRGRGSGRNPAQLLTSAPPDATDRQRPHAPAAPRPSLDLMRMSPYPGLRHLDSRIFDARRRPDRRTGGAELELGDAVGNRHRDQRPHRRQPDA